ncbi:kinesin-related protein 4-like isoform X2 [Penaeus japonicus]|uniref:kinesin-related protein 4-like isoform X2 n=1 Tax=Penaeus japonicus TaxID=27405 RepID=UPI001C717A20|nr:kinesin-related protein 4-like isoform X2 [Penaeus japonicus]
MSDNEHEHPNKEDLQGKEDEEEHGSKESESSLQETHTTDDQIKEEVVEENNRTESIKDADHVEEGGMQSNENSEEGLMLWLDEGVDSENSEDENQKEVLDDDDDDDDDDASLQDEDTVPSNVEEADLAEEDGSVKSQDEDTVSSNTEEVDDGALRLQDEDTVPSNVEEADLAEEDGSVKSQDEDTVSSNTEEVDDGALRLQDEDIVSSNVEETDLQADNVSARLQDEDTVSSNVDKNDLPADDSSARLQQDDDTVSSNTEEADGVALRLQDEDTVSSDVEETDLQADNGSARLQDEDTVSSNTEEADGGALQLQDEDTVSSNVDKADLPADDSSARFQQDEDTVSNNVVETDLVADTGSVKLQQHEEDIVSSNVEETDLPADDGSARLHQDEDIVSSNTEEVDDDTLQLQDEDTVSSNVEEEDLITDNGSVKLQDHEEEIVSSNAEETDDGALRLQNEDTVSSHVDKEDLPADDSSARLHQDEETVSSNADKVDWPVDEAEGVKLMENEDKHLDRSEEKDMQPKKEEEEENTQEGEKEKIVTDDEEEEGQVNEEVKIKTDEEERMRTDEEVKVKTVEEERMRTDEEVEIKTDEEEKMRTDEEVEIKTDEEEKMRTSEEEKSRIDEEEKMRTDEEAKIRSDEEEKTKTDGKESSQAEEEKEEDMSAFKEGEDQNIKDSEDIQAQDAEIPQAREDEDINSGEEAECQANQDTDEDKQIKSKGKEEVTTEQDATQVSKDEIQESSKNEAVTDDPNEEDNAEKSPVLGQKRSRRTLSFDHLESTKAASESDDYTKDDEGTPPDDSGIVQTSDESQSTSTSPIIGSRSKDNSGSPLKHDGTGLIAEDKCNLIITSVRGKVSDFIADDETFLASGSSDVSQDKSREKVECFDISSESETDTGVKDCKALVCKRCRNIWTEKVLQTIFKGSEPVTVKSKITFGAIVLINNWAHKHLEYNRETAVRNTLERADLGKNIKDLKISDLSQWLSDLMDKGKIRCCAVFDAIYKPEPIEVSLSSLKTSKGGNDKPKITPTGVQEAETPKKRPFQPEEEQLSDSQNFPKVAEGIEDVCTKKKQKLDELQAVEEKRAVKVSEQKPSPDAEVSMHSPKQTCEVSTKLVKNISEPLPSTSEIESKEVLDEDQLHTEEQVLPKTKPSQAEEADDALEEGDDHEESTSDHNIVVTSVLQQEEETELNLHDTKERDDDQSMLCKKLGLDIDNIDISCSSSDMKRVNNGTMAKQDLVEEEVSRAHATMLKERSALHGFASEAFDLLPFEVENFYDSAHEDESVQRYMTNRELLTLHSIFILDAELPNAELFYQVLIQILMSRNQVLLVPDSRTLLQVLEKLRRDFNRAKVGKSYSQFLAQDWDMRNIYTSENLWGKERAFPNNPNIRNLLSIFCLWKNIGKQLTDFSPSSAIQEMCKSTDLSSTDKLGMCVRLYARFCAFLYKENHPELAELFLDRKFTMSNISISREALINSMKCLAVENQRIETSLTITETEVTQALQNCIEAEKMVLRSETPKTVKHFQRLLKQFEQKLDRYRDTNTELVKRIRVAESRRDKLESGINDPNLRASVQELTDGLNTIHRNKRKRSTLDEADQSAAKFVARSESEVTEDTKEVIHDILAKGVKPELVRTVIQTVMNKVTGESALNLPDVFWIRKYAQENGFQSTVS